MLHDDTRLYTIKHGIILCISCQGTWEGTTMPMLEHLAPEETLLTFKEAMSFLRVSRSTLYRLMWSGQLRGHKVGSTWRFHRQDLLALVADSAQIAAPLQSYEGQ